MFFFKRRGKDATPAKTVAEFATCERITAGPTSALHLRYLRNSSSPELVLGGGLRSRGITAACGAEVAWDRRAIEREEVIAGLPHQHETFHYCKECLDFTGILAHV